MSGKAARALAATVLAASIIPGLVVTASSAAAAQDTFIGYGAVPSDAHSDAVRQMNAFSPSCVEISTTYSEAGSEDSWQATLTAQC
jgi:hypothetical protein